MHERYTMWSIDVELCIPKAANPTPFSLCIRNMKIQEVVLYTRIDYNMSLQDIQSEFEAHPKQHSNTGRLAQHLHVESFGRYYEDDATSDMTLTAVGDASRAVGYTPNTHRVFLWCTYADGQFSRELYSGTIP
jgi:hypothetical protein